jgi:glutaconyl-CoA/methylmalonyl-CoA decarboxylase subunit gamma
MKLRIQVEGSSYDVQVDVMPEGAAPALEGEVQMPAAPPPPPDTIPDDKICRSPIAGTVVSVAVAPGVRVRQHDPVATIEAMKMQTPICAVIAGLVQEVAVRPGQSVKMGQVLCKLA